MVRLKKGFLLDNSGKRRKGEKKKVASLTTTQQKRTTATTTTTKSIDDDKKTNNNKEVLSSSSSNNNNNDNTDKGSNDDDSKTKMQATTTIASSSSSSRTTSSEEEGRRVGVGVGNNGGGSDSSGGLFVKGFLNKNNNKRCSNNKESSSSSSSKTTVPPKNRRKEEFSYTSESSSSSSSSIKNNNNNNNNNKINGFAKGFLNNNNAKTKLDIKKNKKKNNNNNKDDDNEQQQQQITTTKKTNDNKNKNNNNDIGSRGGGFSKGFLLTKSKKKNNQQKRNNDNKYSYNDNNNNNNNTTTKEENEDVKESQHPSSSSSDRVPQHQHNNNISSDLLAWEQEEIIIPTSDDDDDVNNNINNNNTTSTTNSGSRSRRGSHKQPPPPLPTSSTTRLVQILSSINNNNDDDNHNNNNKQFPPSASSNNNDDVDNYYDKGSSIIGVDSSGSTIKHPLISIIDENDDDDDNNLLNNSSISTDDHDNNNNNSDNHDEEDKIIFNMKKKKNEPILDIGITTTQMKSKNDTIKQQQQDDEQPLWKEVSTTIRRINKTTEDPEIFVTSQQQQQQQQQQQVKQQNLQSPFTLSSSSTDQTEDMMIKDDAAAEYVAVTPSEVTKSTKPQSSSYIDFQQDLESFMWNNNNASKSNRPRRRTSTTLPTDDDTTTTTREYTNNNNSSIIFLETVKDWDRTTKVQWSWEWILLNNSSTKNNGKQQQPNLSSSKQPNNSPRHQLMMTLLRHHPTSIVPYLIQNNNDNNNNNNNNTQEEGKIVALQCVRIIQDYCICNLERKTNSTITKKMILCKKQQDLITDWKTIILDALLQMLFQQQQPLPRRTVLAQNVCTAAICVIANIAFEFITIISEEEGQRKTGHYHHSIISELESILFPDISNHFERILKLQISWKKQQQKQQAANNDKSKKKAAAESSSNMKKKKKNNRLMIAILEDWLRINQSYKSGKISSFVWCNQLFGIEFKTFQTWGGLLDTLVTNNKSPSSSNVSSFTNNFIQDVEDAISECDKVFETTRRRKTSSKNDDDEDDDTNEFIIGCSLFRGVLVSAVTNKDASSSSFQEMVGPSLGLLSKCKRNQGFSALILAFLDFIWWDSDGLPPDIKSVPQNTATIRIPESIDIILDTLTKCRKTDEEDGALENDHDPAFQAISRILARCIDAYYDSFALTKAIVARLGIGICTIQILFDLIQRFDDMGHGPNDESNKTAGEDVRDNGLIPYAAKILIDNIPKSSYLRSYLRKKSSCGLYSSPIPVTVPKLLRLLSLRQGNESETNEIRSTILMVLKSILRAHVQIGNTDCVVKETINALDTLQEEVKNDGVDLVGDICGKLGGGWRRELLVNSSISTDAIGDVLLSIGDAMFASPSSLTPLTLLGSIVGVDLDRTSVREDSVRMRIMVAITRLIMFCTDRLHQSNTVKGEDAVFSRLSPLLMLRRIPVTYFEIAREENKAKESEELEVALSVLTTELASRLDINQTTRTITEISADERRLAAEVAGRCLSFGATENDRKQATIFGGLCKPAFSALSHQCVPRISNLCISTIRSARAALYAACIHVPFAKGRKYFFFSDDAYLLTSCFALDIVNLDTDRLEDEAAGEFLQLQRGCIQFFASCVEKSVVSQNNSSENSSRPLVIESNGQIERTKDPSLTALRRICRNLTAIIRGGKVDEPFIKGKWSRSVGITEASPVSYSVSARVCIWNCFIIAAQSMSMEDGSLMTFAKSILPWVIEWGNLGSVPNETRHPLCVAAALQLTFTLVTRTRTLECLTANNSQGPPIKTVVRDAHDWALEAAKDNSTISKSNSGSAMRLAGLKLLLAIITISSDETSLPTHLTPDQVGKSFSVMHGIANLDPNPDVRNLASRILGFRP